MVLSLSFVLALVGSAVGLIIGMVIYGDISEAIECPVGEIIGGGGGGGNITTTAPNTGTYGSDADGLYFEDNVQMDFQVASGILSNGVYQEGTSTLEDQGEVRFGSNLPQWNFLHDGDTGSNLVSINFWINGDIEGGPSYPVIDTLHCNFYDTTCVTYGFTVQGVNDDNGVLVYTQSGSLQFYVYNGGSNIFNAQWLDGAPPDDSNWHMITLVYDKSDSSGITCTDGSCSSFWVGAPTAFTISGQDAVSTLSVGTTHGCCGGVTENGFLVDDFTVWNGYTLTQTDIDDMWNSGVGSSAGATGESIELSSQVLHVTFDEGTGSPSSEGQVGAEQCQQAKDISWTVIGIIPVALFFALFAIFSALGTGKQ